MATRAWGPLKLCEKGRGGLERCCGCCGVWIRHPLHHRGEEVLKGEFVGREEDCEEKVAYRKGRESWKSYDAVFWSGGERDRGKQKGHSLTPHFERVQSSKETLVRTLK
jgi:hypothetical protein